MMDWRKYRGRIASGIMTGKVSGSLVVKANQEMGIRELNEITTNHQANKHKIIMQRLVREHENYEEEPVVDIAVDDIVRLRTGQAPIRVTHVRRDAICGVYVSGTHEFDWRRITDFVFYENFNKNPCGEIPLGETNEGDNDMKTLYQTNEDKPRFGEKLAVNSAGLIVLEMKGTGEVEAFDPKAIEEVLPWTFTTEPVSPRGHVDPSRSYIAEKGKVKKGDLLLSDSGNLSRVTATNTRCRNPKGGEFKGVKLKTEAI